MNRTRNERHPVICEISPESGPTKTNAKKVTAKTSPIAPPLLCRGIMSPINDKTMIPIMPIPMPINRLTKTAAAKLGAKNSPNEPNPKRLIPERKSVLCLNLRVKAPMTNPKKSPTTFITKLSWLAVPIGTLKVLAMSTSRVL